jgi:hypothetical protein
MKIHRRKAKTMNDPIVTPSADHAPDTYKVYQTPHGWEVRFLDRQGNLRPSDGKNFYPSNPNAYARAKQLNHPIEYAMRDASIVEAYWDRYTLSVREDVDGDGNDCYTLSIGVEGMPPHYQQDFKTIADVEEEIRDRSAMPLYLDWEAVEGE